MSAAPAVKGRIGGLTSSSCAERRRGIRGGGDCAIHGRRRMPHWQNPDARCQPPLWHGDPTIRDANLSAPDADKQLAGYRSPEVTMLMPARYRLPRSALRPGIVGRSRPQQQLVALRQAAFDGWPSGAIPAGLTESRHACRPRSHLALVPASDTDDAHRTGFVECGPFRRMDSYLHPTTNYQSLPTCFPTSLMILITGRSERK
jgi:hypothetical protein